MSGLMWNEEYVYCPSCKNHKLLDYFNTIICAGCRKTVEYCHCEASK